MAGSESQETEQLSGAEQGELNHEAFENWTATQKPHDYKAIIRGSQLNRTKVADGCGFDTQVLSRNPAVKKALADLEDGLRDDGILPRKSASPNKTNGTSTSDSEEYDQSANKTKILIRRNQQLEDENLTLKADVAKLKKALKPYEELANVLADTGVNLR